MFIFGIFSLIHYPFIYLIGSPKSSTHFIEIVFRITIIIGCLPLCFVYHWPEKLKEYLYYYWYVCITYALPFFATYMFIDYDGMQPWPTKMAVALLWLVLITSWSQFLISVFVGSVAAILIQATLFDLNPFESNITLSDVLNSLWIVVVASVFAVRRETAEKEKHHKARITALQMQAAAIAHEMRTPLFNILGKVRVLKSKIPLLIKDYQLNHHEKDPQNVGDLITLGTLPDDLRKTAERSLSIIDIILTSLNSKSSKSDFEAFSIVGAIEDALASYPLTKKEKGLIHVDKSLDFQITGNPPLIRHVFFNLLKNSLYYIKASGKGEIYIWTEIKNKEHCLYFKDTGQGIPKKILHRIFDDFFTRTDYGAGVGLSFCKKVVTDMGGTISCTSEEGEFVQFILTFPV
jgi:signal transduction histidine kinase